MHGRVFEIRNCNWLLPLNLATDLLEAVLDLGAFVLQLRVVSVRKVLAERQNEESHDGVHNAGYEKREAPCCERCGVEADDISHTESTKN